MRFFQVDTGLALDDATPSYGFRKGAYARRELAPVAIVIHSTGWGVMKRAKRWGMTPFEAAVRAYEGSFVGRSGPHYVVGQGGELAQLCPENFAAWHVGAYKHRAYLGTAWYSQAPWWRERWARDVTSPLLLADGDLWRGGSCNANSIGIEVVPSDEGPKAKWSPAAIDKLSRLVRDICSRKASIPRNRFHILTHADAHPLARTRGGAPFDTYATQFAYGDLL